MRRVVGGVDYASQRGGGRVKASRGQACGYSGEAKTTPREGGGRIFALTSTRRHVEFCRARG